VSGSIFTDEIDTHYRPADLQARWQEVWRRERAFATPPPGDGRAPAYVFADCTVARGARELGQIRRYVIADACARFLRAQGRAVLFSMGLDAFGELAETESMRAGVSPEEWTRCYYEHTRERLETLGCSCDWERTFLSSAPELFRWTQWLFLTLLEHNCVYRRGHEWFMRIAPPADEDTTPAALTGWDDNAIAIQEQAIGRIEGVELEANTFSTGTLTVFTPHVQAIGDARFVAISPRHPNIERWTVDSDIAETVAAMRELAWRQDDGTTEQIPLVATEDLAMIGGVAGMLPIVISPLVDARFGPTAVLGLPALDPVDQAIAARLPAPARAAWTVSGSAAAHPAVRYRSRDVAVSHARAWGAPVPVIHCPRCGQVPVAVAELPVGLGDDTNGAVEQPRLNERDDCCECACPTCNGASRRDTATIDSRFDRMWLWMASCMPAERRAGPLSCDEEHARWLPACQLITDTQMGAGTFERRVLAGTLQDLGKLPRLANREPLCKVFTHGDITLPQEDVSLEGGASLEPPAQTGDVDALLARFGADAMRLAILYAASPAHEFRWSDERVRHCHDLLQDLYAYARPRLERWPRHPERPSDPASIDTSDPLRRRLAYWCAVACEQLTTNLEKLQLQRAAHNAIRLTTRIRDFERRARQQRGQLEQADQEAVVATLLLLARLLAPLTPHLAEELWSAIGRENVADINETRWPDFSRPHPPGSQPAGVDAAP
jgi:leucyl-tRNA synthetase